MPKRDQLSNEVSIKGAISESGISAAAKSRAIAAIDHFLGNLIFLPSTYIQSKIDQMQAKSDQDIKMIVAEGDARVEKFKQQIDAEISQNSTMKNLKKLLNKRRVVEHAVGILKDEASNDESSTILELDEDWLNNFEDFVEKISSEQLQNLWARILAGEIGKPRSFSLATLRFMSEVDTECAQLFERATEHYFEDGFILRPKKMKGRLLLDLIFLEEVGLLQEVGTNLKRSGEPESDGLIKVRNGQYMLVLKGKSSINFDVIRVTRVGREIIKMLPPKNHIAALEHMFEGVAGEVTEAIIYLVTDESEDQILATVVKVLKQECN